MKLNGILKFIRLQPFDISTSEGRSNERYRMAIWSFLANIVSKIMALAVMFLSVRWTLPYLGAERFGVWMTVASLTTMLVVLDLGIGNALTNHIAHAAAEDNPEKLKKTISGSLGFLFIVALVMGALLTLLASYLPLEKLVKVEDVSLKTEIHQTFLVFAILFGINMFSSGVQKLFAGLQRTFEGYISSAICSLLSLICVAIAAQEKASIPLLLTLTLGLQSLGGYLLLVLLIKRKMFSFEKINSKIKLEYKQLYKTGIVYFALQIGVLLGWGADSLIISSILGATYVAVYSVAQRLFQLSIMSLHMINGPLWGAYADANARNDKEFIKKTLYKSMKITFILSLLSLMILLTFNKIILKLWLSSNIEISLYFLIAFACWTFFECLTGAFNIFLNGLHIVRPQLYSVALFILVSLTIKLLFTEKYGVIVIPLATTFAYFVSTVILYRFFFFNEIKKAIN
jgi:O-antigen/teichoic acid export membrane protein